MTKEEQDQNEIPLGYLKKFRSDVWEISGVSDPDHPAVFPYELAEAVVLFYSVKGDTVLDPFAGTGTTGVACIRHKRKFVMIEKDKKYYQVLRQRIKDAKSVKRLDDFKDAKSVKRLDDFKDAKSVKRLDDFKESSRIKGKSVSLDNF